MSRISTEMQYDNRDVIKQISDLRSANNNNADRIEDLEAATAGGIVDMYALNSETSARKAADTVLQSNISSEAGTRASDDLTIQTNLDVETATRASADNTLKAKIDQDIKDVTVSTDASTTSMTLVKQGEANVVRALPVASSVQSGVMDVATYDGLASVQSRVTALENRQTMFTVSFDSDNPTQAEVTLEYTSSYPLAPNPPDMGTVVADLNRSIQYTWDATNTLWVRTTTGVSQATNDTLGLVKGSLIDGQSFIQTDGTQSVNGWDALKGRVASTEAAITSCESDIDTNTTNIETLQTAVSQLNTDIVEKMDKNVGPSNAGKVATVDTNGDYTPVVMPSAINVETHTIEYIPVDSISLNNSISYNTNGYNLVSRDGYGIVNTSSTTLYSRSLYYNITNACFKDITYGSKPAVSNTTKVPECDHVSGLKTALSGLIGKYAPFNYITVGDNTVSNGYSIIVTVSRNEYGIITSIDDARYGGPNTTATTTCTLSGEQPLFGVYDGSSFPNDDNILIAPLPTS